MIWRRVQTLLQKLGYYDGKVDGINGPITTFAIKSYQKTNSLKPDGIAGPVTLAVMFPTDPQPPPPTGEPWKGAARLLLPSDIGAAANGLGIEPATLIALTTVLGAGSGFDTENRVRVVYEPHIAYRLTTGAVRDALIADGLAYSHWGEHPYPGSSAARYSQVRQTMAIAPEAAFNAAAWGLGQVMGFNAGQAGYTDAAAMIRAFADGEDNQLWGACNMIAHNRLALEALKNHQWEIFMEAYSGRADTKGGTAQRLAEQYRRARQ
jgi:hypothetical protein